MSFESCIGCAQLSSRDGYIGPSDGLPDKLLTSESWIWYAMTCHRALAAGLPLIKLMRMATPNSLSNALQQLVLNVGCTGPTFDVHNLPPHALRVPNIQTLGSSVNTLHTLFSRCWPSGLHRSVLLINSLSLYSSAQENINRTITPEYQNRLGNRHHASTTISRHSRYQGRDRLLTLPTGSPRANTRLRPRLHLPTTTPH